MKATRADQELKARYLKECLGIGWVPAVNVSEFFSIAYENPKLKEAIDLLEENFNVLVYYVTHEVTSFGECYSFLYVSSYLEDFPHHDIRVGENGEMVVLAYVWNVDKKHCSEFGSIVVKNKNGVLVRIG